MGARQSKPADIRNGAHRKQGGRVNAAGLIRIVSSLLTVLVVVSYGLFMYDELGSASKNQSNIAANGQSVVATRDTHGRMTGPETSSARIKIDKANDTVTSPGESIGKSLTSNEWGGRTMAFLFGLLVFGVGGRLLAAYVEKSSMANRGNNPPAPGQSEYTATYRS